MSTPRKKPAGRKPAAPRKPAKPTAKRATGKKQRRYSVRSPVSFHKPVVRNKRRPKRKTTITVGSVLVAILTVTAYIVVGVVAAVVTGLITGVATGIAASRSEPNTPKREAAPDQTGRPSGGKPGTPKQPPPGSVMCAAPTRGGGKCMRFTAPGQNCGVPSHPAPPGGHQVDSVPRGQRGHIEAEVVPGRALRAGTRGPAGRSPGPPRGAA